MLIVHDARCAEFGSHLRPEQPARVLRTVPHLQAAHPEWTWQTPVAADDDACTRVHTTAHLERLARPPDFDEDTPYFPNILAHARRSAGAAIAAAEGALDGRRTFSLMRPPGHHATADRAMGFCYLNSVAIAALHVLATGRARRVAVWDFDAHHGNGTEAILAGRENTLFASVHQSPGYPGTGNTTTGNVHNWLIPPRGPRSEHLDALRASLDTVIAFDPDLVLVSAGFDAFVRDPITAMSLEIDDFSTLGAWLREADRPVAAVLEGGYSADLPQLVDAFLTAWAQGDPA